MKLQRHILAVDDNTGVRTAMEMLLRPKFEKVTTIGNPSLIRETITGNDIDAVILDMNFRSVVNNGNEGLYWLSEIKRVKPALPVILLTAYADVELAVRGMREGASDFIVKPWDNDRLVETVIRVTEGSGKGSGNHPAVNMEWGTSASMSRLRDLVLKAAPTDANILITGENGTGKDILAHEIHERSMRCGRQFVSVDMGCLTDSLFESEMFGHRKGAFTGAHADRKGKMEEASGGTLFLDEICNMPVGQQAKLLVALQSRRVTPVGGNHATDIDVRVISATNSDINRAVADGSFREDLLYRINTIHLHLPPLRERKDDIVLMALRFVDEFAKRYKRGSLTLSESATDILVKHAWPGNVRELRHAVEKAVITCNGDRLLASDFTLVQPSRPTAPATEEITIADMERQMIIKAIEGCNGNLSAAALRLGITRQTLYNKMKRYNL